MFWEFAKDKKINCLSISSAREAQGLALENKLLAHLMQLTGTKRQHKSPTWVIWSDYKHEESWVGAFNHCQVGNALNQVISLLRQALLYYGQSSPGLSITSGGWDVS